MYFLLGKDFLKTFLAITLLITIQGKETRRNEKTDRFVVTLIRGDGHDHADQHVTFPLLPTLPDFALSYNECILYTLYLGT